MSSEDEITEWFARQSKLSAEEFPIGIGDDMAEIRVGQESVLVTTDTLLDGVHFELEKTGLKQVGYKAVAVSLSDCAAMATIPVAAIVAVALPAGFGDKELKELHSGITLAGGKFGCELIGGDITSWKQKERFVISVTILSKHAATKPVRRSGAKIGDAICVTGTLGGAGFKKHLEFEPRVNEAIEIAQKVTINSMIDISDGLSSDLNRICRASGVGAVIEAERIPVSDEAKKSDDPLKAALNDGEDFELLFTLGEKKSERLLQEWRGPIPITRIGTVTKSSKMQIKIADGQIKDLEVGGYNHLK